MRKDEIVFKLFERDLKNYQPIMVTDLLDLLLGKTVVYLEHEQNSNLAYFYGEYCYEYFTSSFWAMNKTGDIISLPINLPTEEKREDFLSQEFQRKAIELEDDLYDDFDDDEVIDIMDEFSDQIHDYFENWFRECWLKAVELSGVQIDAYFSVHDSLIHTELNSNQQRNEDEIMARMSNMM